MSDIQGEMAGDFEKVFFGSLNQTPAKHRSQINDSQIPKLVSTDDIAAMAMNKTTQLKQTNNKSNTIINISKEVLNTEHDVQVTLTEQEELRMNTFSLIGKEFINIDTGELAIVKEQTNMFDGSTLIVLQIEGYQKLITFPRSKFIGPDKIFIPKKCYIADAERAIYSLLVSKYLLVKEILEEHRQIPETSDGLYLELLLPKPLDITEEVKVPDKIKIPVNLVFDLNYKMMVIEYVICFENKIAALLINDIWF